MTTLRLKTRAILKAKLETNSNLQIIANIIEKFKKEKELLTLTNNHNDHNKE